MATTFEKEKADGYFSSEETGMLLATVVTGPIEGCGVEVQLDRRGVTAVRAL